MEGSLHAKRYSVLTVDELYFIHRSWNDLDKLCAGRYLARVPILERRGGSKMNGLFIRFFFFSRAII